MATAGRPMKGAVGRSTNLRRMETVERLDRIERKRVALLNEVANLEPWQLVAHPILGKWSICEIIEHLVLAEKDVVGDFSRLGDLEEQPRGFKNYVLYIVVMFILKFSIPVKTPSAAMVPRGEQPLDHIRKMWDENHRHLRSFVGGLDQRGTRRVIFGHPITGPISVSQGIRMLDVHLDTHIRQIRKLKQLLLVARSASS